MSTTRALLGLLLLSTLAPPTGGKPIFIHTREIAPQGLPRANAVSIWTVASRKSPLTMHWTCTPFEPMVAGAELCDASMWLHSLRWPFPQKVKILRPFDRTDLTEGRNEATVIAKSFRSGITRMRLTVGIEDKYCPAGKYTTTVNLTVSAL